MFLASACWGCLSEMIGRMSQVRNHSRPRLDKVVWRLSKLQGSHENLVQLLESGLHMIG